MYEHKVELDDGDGNTETVVLTLKPLTQIPIGVLRKHRGDSEAQMWATFEWGLPEEQLDVFDRIPADQIEAIMTGWQADDGKGVPVGESSASPASSTGTARPSKQTSSGTDSD
jgi:hypothetical protein